MHTRGEFYTNLDRLQQRFETMEPELEVTVRDSSLALEGHIVVWNTSISKTGPLPHCAKGGTRIRPGLSLDEVKMLARNMAIKNAAANLPLGGCKSGLNAQPDSPIFEKQYRRFVELCKPFTYENGGTFGGFGFDIGAAPEHALWACDTLGSTRSFTGKTVEMGGTDYDREGIAGLGVAESAYNILTIHSEQVNNIRFAIHGAGAMGAAVIRYFSEYGAKLCALGDPKFGGTWRFEKPLSKSLLDALVTQDTERAYQHMEKEGQKISGDANQVLLTPTDVLFPCAIQHVITEENADEIKAKYIIEGANNPTTLDAYDRLFQRGVHQIPDFIANCGGVIAAFVELTSDISNEENARTRAKVREAKDHTRNTIKDNVIRVVELSKQFDISLRDAGLFIALEAIFKHEATQ